MVSGRGETEVKNKKARRGRKGVTLGCCKASRQSRQNKWEPCTCACMLVTLVNRLERQVEEKLEVHIKLSFN